MPPHALMPELPKEELIGAALALQPSLLQAVVSLQLLVVGSFLLGITFIKLCPVPLHDPPGLPDILAVMMFGGRHAMIFHFLVQYCAVDMAGFQRLTIAGIAFFKRNFFLHAALMGIASSILMAHSLAVSRNHALMFAGMAFTFCLLALIATRCTPTMYTRIWGTFLFVAPFLMLLVGTFTDIDSLANTQRARQSVYSKAINVCGSMWTGFAHATMPRSRTWKLMLLGHAIFFATMTGFIVSSRLDDPGVIRWNVMHGGLPMVVTFCVRSAL